MQSQLEIRLIQNQQTAITALMANLSALKGSCDVLGKSTLYGMTTATSSNSGVLSVATTGTPTAGHISIHRIKQSPSSTIRKRRL